MPRTFVQGWRSTLQIRQTNLLRSKAESFWTSHSPRFLVQLLQLFQGNNLQPSLQSSAVNQSNRVNRSSKSQKLSSRRNQNNSLPTKSIPKEQKRPRSKSCLERMQRWSTRQLSKLLSQRPQTLKLKPWLSMFNSSSSLSLRLSLPRSKFNPHPNRS